MNDLEVESCVEKFMQLFPRPSDEQQRLLHILFKPNYVTEVQAAMRTVALNGYRNLIPTLKNAIWDERKKRVKNEGEKQSFVMTCAITEDDNRIEVAVTGVSEPLDDSGIETCKWALAGYIKRFIGDVKYTAHIGNAAAKKARMEWNQRNHERYCQIIHGSTVKEEVPEPDFDEYIKEFTN